MTIMVPSLKAASGVLIPVCMGMRAHWMNFKIDFGNALIWTSPIGRHLTHPYSVIRHSRRVAVALRAVSALSKTRPAVCSAECVPLIPSTYFFPTSILASSVNWSWLMKFVCEHLARLFVLCLTRRSSGLVDQLDVWIHLFLIIIATYPYT